MCALYFPKCARGSLPRPVALSTKAPSSLLQPGSDLSSHEVDVLLCSFMIEDIEMKTLPPFDTR